MHSTSGRPISAGGGLSLDLLPEKWIGSFRSDTQVLPEDLHPAGARAAVLQSWELAAGPKVIETSALRLDAFAGARAWALRVADSTSGLPSDDVERETWVDPIAGLRADFPLAEGFTLRFRGDAALGNSGSENAWRASAAGIFHVSTVVSLSLGWETSSVHYDRGRGADRVLYDVTLSGPFLALEIRF